MGDQLDLFGGMSARERRRYERVAELKRRVRDESWREYLERVHAVPKAVVFDDYSTRTPEERATARRRSAEVRDGVHAYLAAVGARDAV